MLEVVKVGWFYRIRNEHGDFWWSGSTPNWSRNHFTVFLFRRSAINMALRIINRETYKVVWRSDSKTTDASRSPQ